jgi:hypothetical protein
VTASEIIARARSLSDLPNSQFVSHSDEVQSVNESWKDLYQSLLEQGDDDYFVNQTIVTLTPAMSVGDGEWQVTLPTDFYKLRYVDYRGATLWTEMDKFPLSMRDYNPMEPYYRLKNGNLWIIGATSLSTSLQIRIAYFPPPVAITAPQNDFVYGTSYSGSAFTALLSPGYAPLNETAIYANGLVITAESQMLSTVKAPVALFTEATAPSNFIYWKGTLFYLRGGLMWYKVTSLAAAFTAPTQVGAIANVVAFYIAADTIYYANATQIRSCTLTGGSDTLLTAAVATSLAVIGPTIIYRTAASVVTTVAPATTMYASGIAKVTSDGSGSNVLYILDNSGNTRRVTFNVTTAAILTDDIVDSNVTDIGQPSVDPNQNPITTIVPTLKAGYQQLLGVDGTVDYAFTYPNTVATEIVAHQCAIDWRVKQNNDITGLLLRIGHRSGSEGPGTGLWGRFEQAAQRDQYKVTRIRQSYDRGGFLR